MRPTPYFDSNRHWRCSVGHRRRSDVENEPTESGHAAFAESGLVIQHTAPIAQALKLGLNACGRESINTKSKRQVAG